MRSKLIEPLHWHSVGRVVTYGFGLDLGSHCFVALDGRDGPGNHFD